MKRATIQPDAIELPPTISIRIELEVGSDRE